MRIQTLLITLVVNYVSSLSIDTAIHQSAIAQTADQIQSLRSVGVPVILPSYVPSGFRRTNFNIINFSNRHTHQATYRHSYQATYKGPNNCIVLVQGADGRFGNPPTIRQWTVNTRLFGEVILKEWDGSESTPRVPNYLTASVSPKGIRFFQKYSKVGYIFDFSCRYSVFSRQEALQILKSMRIVR